MEYIANADFYKVADYVQRYDGDGDSCIAALAAFKAEDGRRICDVCAGVVYSGTCSQARQIMRTVTVGIDRWNV